MCVYKNIYLESLNDTFLAFLFYEKKFKSIIKVIKYDYDLPEFDDIYMVDIEELIIGTDENQENRIVQCKIPKNEFKSFRRKIEIHKALFDEYPIEERSLTEKQIKKLYHQRLIRESKEFIKKNSKLNEQEKEITKIDYSEIKYPKELEVYSTRELLDMIDYARKFGYWYYEHPIYSYEELKGVLSHREHVDRGRPQSKKTRRAKALKNKGNSKSKSR